jgi:hypothetical protein
MEKPVGFGSHSGGGATFERTNPNYIEDNIRRLEQAYKECPIKWRKTFLRGMDPQDRRELRRRKVI